MTDKQAVIIVGPQGCGKTTFAEHFKLMLGLDQIVDGAVLYKDTVYMTGTLYLTNRQPKFVPPTVSVLSFEEAKTALDEARAFGNDEVAQALRALDVREGPTGPTGPVLPLPQAGVPGRVLTAKDSNPKDAVSGKKPRWFSFIPVRVLVGLGLAMYEGTRKYGRHNYRISGVRASVYVDAAICGHLQPFWEGQDIDPESGLHHLDKAMASIAVLRDAVYEGNWVDDRPPRVKDYDTMMKQAETLWREIQERHPDAVPPWTQKRVDQETTPQE